MRFGMGLVVLALHLTLVGSYPVQAASPGTGQDQAREAQPAPISSPWAEEIRNLKAEIVNLKAQIKPLEDALLAIGDERDALRMALKAARLEIERARAALDAQAGILAECSSDLDAALAAGEGLKASNDVLDDLLNKERRAGKRARWMAWLKVGVPAAAAGYLAGELSGP